MAPKAKAKSPAPKPKAKGAAAPKAAAGSAPKAVAVLRAGAASPDKAPGLEQAEKAEALLRECLAEQDISKVDGRVLDIAIGQAKFNEAVDAALLASAEQRLAEFRDFEVELKKKADEFREQKAQALERDEEENSLFGDACAARRGRRKMIDLLFEAVGDGDVDNVRKFLSECTGSEEDSLLPPPLPVDVEDHEANTALSEAACYGELEIVQLLLERGAHPDVRNKQGRTPLWRATYNGHEEVVKFLIDQGADASIANNNEEPPGVYGTAATKELIKSWSPEKMEGSREKFTDLQRLKEPWPRLLQKACKDGDCEAASSVVAAVAADGGARALLRTVIDFENMADGFWIACTLGHVELVQALIAKEADVNSFSETGLTCLMIACRKGHAKIVAELLAQKSRTHVRSEQGRLALDYSREPASNAITDMLLAHCQKHKDWTTLDENARQSGGNKACGADAVQDVLDDRKNASASDAATAQLRSMSASELREGGDNYQRILEERALADVLGVG